MSERNPDIHYVENTDDVVAMLATVEQWVDDGRYIALDTETGSVHDLWVPGGRGFCRLFQVGVDDEAFVVPAQDHHRAVGEVLEMLSTEPVVLANYKYDYHVFDKEGWPKPINPHDVILMHRVARPHRNRHSLKELAMAELGEWAGAGASVLKSVMKKGGWTWETIPINNPAYVYYAGFDTCITANAFKRLMSDMPSYSFQAYYMEQSYQRATFEMEKKGMRVSLDKLGELDYRWWEEARNLQLKLEAKGIYNPSSNRQVELALAALGFEPEEFSDAGNPVLDKAVLTKLKDKGGVMAEVAEDLMRYRRVIKWRKVYVEKMEASAHEERVHCNIKTRQARTTRSSVTDPPLQTIPKDKDTRGIFIADPGHELWTIDYDSQEARILADVSGEPSLIKLFTGGDGDIHQLVADALGITRTTAKTVVYAKLFGAGDKTLGAAIGGTEENGRQINAMMRERFPRLEKWMREIVDQGTAENGIILPSGNHLVAPEGEEYKYINYAIQGRGAAILKNAVITLSMAGFLDFILMVVHDEIVFQFPEGEGAEKIEQIVKLMESTLPSGVVLTCQAEGPFQSWGDKYE